MVAVLNQPYCCCASCNMQIIVESINNNYCLFHLIVYKSTFKHHACVLGTNMQGKVYLMAYIQLMVTQQTAIGIIANHMTCILHMIVVCKN